MNEKQQFSDYLVKIPGKVTPFRMDPDLYCLDHKGELELCHTRSKISDVLTLYQKQKRIKKCRNLKLLSTSHVEDNSYPIICKKQSLYWHVLKNKKEEPEVLLGCPPSCQFYKLTWKEKIKKVIQFLIKKSEV